MSSRVRFVLNRKGVREMLRSEEMEAALSGMVNGIQQKAGDGYEASTKAGKNRIYASVIAKSAKAKKDNLKNNTLLKALGSTKV